MGKIFTAVLVLLLIVALQGFAQTPRYAWEFVKAFPDTNFKGPNGCHGIAVDPAGKIWIQIYSAQDSIYDVARGAYRACRRIYVFNPDGTPSALNGFKTINMGSYTDTMYNSQLGLRTGPDGNIILATFDALYKVNYQTGAGMAKVQPVAGQSQVAPGVDGNGWVYAATVFPNYPVKVYNSNLEYQYNVTDTSTNYCRSVNVSQDGKSFYYTAFANSNLELYYSDDPTFNPYVLTDTLLKGMTIESSGWHKQDSLLYVASGGQVKSQPPYGDKLWYGWNPKTNTIVDSIVWNQAVSPDIGAADCRPRAIDFSPGGDTAYVGEFDGSDVPAVQMFVRRLVSVAELPGTGIPVNYTLSQNYPNPFNPTTTIEFSIPKAGYTTVTVYDVLGREVAQLVNENLKAGSYTTRLDGSKLSSGTYVYVLTAGETRLAKKMLLVK